jgi:hypothetical protein
MTIAVPAVWVVAGIAVLAGPQRERDSLLSGSIDTRLAAAARLEERATRQDERVLTDGTVQDAVVRLLADANAGIAKSYRAGTAQAEPGEEFSQNYAATLHLGLRIAAKADAWMRGRLLSAMVQSVYNPDSSVAQGLAAFDDDIVPPAVSIIRNGDEPQRWAA